MDLHGTIPIFPSVIAEEPVEEEVVFEEQKKEGMEVERQESIEEGLPEASEKQEEHEKEVPILLTQKTQSRLDLAHGSVLFSSHRFEKLVQETMPENKTIVYSWGSGVNSLHDDDEDVALEHARVDSASRVGRTDIMSCSAGPNHAACSTAAGQVLICGRNNTGAVDPDRRGEELIKKPALLESLGEARIVQVSCGFDHTAALRANGAILTWGSNEFGQLGHRLPKNAKPDPASLKFCRPSIMVLGPGRRATAVVCGDGFSLCLTSRMGVLACGREFISGYSEKEGCYHLPAPIPALEDLPLVSVSAGRRHAVVVSAHGSAFAWGENAHGCCGREYPKETSVPVPINVPESRLTPRGPALPKPLSSWAYWEEDSVSLAKDTAVVDAACGDEHTVLVTRSGRLLVCGSNSRGQLGLDPKLKSVVYSVEPVNHQDAGNGRRFVRAEAGQDHTLLLDDMGDVWQLGGDMDSGYEQVLEGKHVQWIAAGGGQNIAIASVPGRSPLRREFSDATGAGDVPLAENVEELIRLLPDEKKAKGNEEQPLGIAANELATRMEELLRTPAVLNSLFLDPTELEDLFAKLLSADNPQVQQTIASAIEKGIQRGLDSVRSDDARLMWPEQVRFLLLYIQCPLFLVWKKEEIFFDRRSDLILCLCETILEMSYEGYCALMCWATSIYPRELFVRLLVDPLLSQLEKAITIGAGAQTRPIPALVSVLRWLYNASERAGGIARPEDFYSSALGNMNPEALLNDLVKYKKASKQERGADFFFCDNPFLFSPSTKRNLLQIESEMNMLKTAAAGLTYNAEERAYEFNPFYVLDIDREHLLTQALDKVSKAEPSDLRKKLRVVFKGEDGVDGT
jgi:alpha-tubulin suppressor-like RCC1 family protein